MTKKDVYHYLSNLHLVVLSTIDEKNMPHGSEMFFIVDEHLNFFLLTQHNTKKYKNILSNQNVALTFINPNETKTVQVQGNAYEIQPSDPLYLGIISKMGEKNARKDGVFWPPPPSKIQDEKIVIIRVTPTWLRYADYSKPAGEIFQQIIP